MQFKSNNVFCQYWHCIIAIVTHNVFADFMQTSSRLCVAMSLLAQLLLHFTYLIIHISIISCMYWSRPITWRETSLLFSLCGTFYFIIDCNRSLNFIVINHGTCLFPLLLKLKTTMGQREWCKLPLGVSLFVFQMWPQSAHGQFA